MQGARRRSGENKTYARAQLLSPRNDALAPSPHK
jgi:hypothetical protein